jgi:hypothetical protein
VIFTPPLNSPLEVGLRVVILLSSAYPRSFDLPSLVQLDHALLHTGLNNGPSSIHPEIPGSVGELAVKQDLVRSGLDAMIRARLITARPSSIGFEFFASENAIPFVSTLESPYVLGLQNRADWLLRQLPIQETGTAEPQFRLAVSRWLAESASPRGGRQDG